ncbi:MAG: universal stress protein [Bacteroidales bacterium]|nr:universal stress protein [Bacteroidales bacterium]
MKLLHKLLITLDFNRSTEHVVANSIMIAKRFNSQVTLMHVIKNEAYSSFYINIIKDSCALKLNDIADRIRAEGIEVADIKLEIGEPFEKIILEAQNNEYNVIIAGSGNKKTEDVYKLGTTVEKIMRKNQIPLWVVKDNDIKEINRILCPVDFSDASHRALNNAIKLADKFNAELTILNVYSPVNIFTTRFEVDNANENALRKTKQEEDFHNFLKQFNLAGIKHKVEIKEGEVSYEILDYIKSNNIDLLLMGTTGKTGLSRLLMGSVTEKVTREVPCSFITTKAQDITDNYFESNLSSIESIINSAKLSVKQKNYERALEKYGIALKQYPDNIPVIIGLIEINKLAGNDNQVKLFKEYAQEVVRRLWGEEYLDKFNF